MDVPSPGLYAAAVPSIALYSSAEQDLRLFYTVQFNAHAVVDVHSSGR